MASLEQLERRFPNVAWREPAPMSVFSAPDEKHYACRVCIANDGLKGHQVPGLPTDPQVVDKHIREVHMATTIDERRADHI